MARKFKVKMAEIYKILCQFSQNGENFKKIAGKYQKWQNPMMKMATVARKNVKVNRQKCKSGPTENSHARGGPCLCKKKPYPASFYSSI